MPKTKLPSGIFEQFFESSPDMLCIAGTDGYFRHVNRSFENTLGWTAKVLREHPYIEFVHPDDVERTLAEIDSLKGGAPTTVFENRFRTADGSYRTLHWSAYPRPNDGLLFAIARDYTEMSRVAHRFRIALEASPVATLVVDQDSKIRIVNSAVEQLFGYPREDMLDGPLERLIPPRLHAKHAALTADFFEKPRPRPMGSGRQVVGLHENGYEFPVEIGLNPIDLEEGPHVIATMVDLTLQRSLEGRLIQASEELKRVNERLAELATTDELTGLINRRAFDLQLMGNLRLMQRLHSPLSVLLLDIDQFKELNDHFGHLAGDTALSDLAVLLEQVARGSDIPARQGGDEFAIILPSTDRSGALRLAERIRSAVREHSWSGQDLTVSVGVATILVVNREPLDDEVHPTLILSAADRALYESKHAGGNRVSYADVLEDPVPAPTN